MNGVLFGLGFSFATAVIVILGDYALKVAADGGHAVRSWLVLFGTLMYAASALCWFYAMKHVTLAQAGVAYSMLTLLALCALGAIVFDEKLALRDYAGIACALLAMVLLFRA
ncbi:MAG: transporter [Pseudomonadota bacterium]